MPAELNRITALSEIENLRLQDAVAWARRLKLDRPPSWPQPPSDLRAIDRAEIQRMLEKERSDRDHPCNWHARAVAKEWSLPRARNMYFTMRRNLWTWPEFLSLNLKARLMLEIVIELAREEAFPWHIGVKAREVMKLARTNHATMAAAMRELQTLAITRPARPIHVFVQKHNNEHDEASFASWSVVQHAGALPRWPCAENNWGVNDRDARADTAQWVIRYRHGSPRNANRAAWWINYDLLCETGRVLPCFVVSPDTLPKTYFNRNRRMGAPATFDDADGFAAMERAFAQQGPLPKSGFRAALWEGM